MVKKKKNENGLVLSGGGIRGMAHIGLIEALRQRGWKADRVAGTSIGALVGAFYANDNSVEDMMHFFKEAPLFQYNFFTINKAGFIDTDRYYDVLKGYFTKDSFEALEIPLHVVATDLLQGEEVCFSEGELIRTLLASAALTPVFSPVKVGKLLCADGGIMNNFPKEYLDPYCSSIVGSNVTIAGVLGPRDLKNPFQITARVTSLMIYTSSRKKLNECQLGIEPKELEKIGVLDKSAIRKAYDIGYDHASRALDQHEKLMIEGSTSV